MLEEWKYFSSQKFRNRRPSFFQFIVIFIKCCRWTIFEFLGVWVLPFIYRYAAGDTHEVSFLCHFIYIFRGRSDREYVTSKVSEFRNTVFISIPPNVRWGVSNVILIWNLKTSSDVHAAWNHLPMLTSFNKAWSNHGVNNYVVCLIIYIDPLCLTTISFHSNAEVIN